MSERVFLRELMDGGRRRVRAHGSLNGRVREIAVDEGRGQAAQFPGGIDAAHSKRRNARNAGCPLAEQTAGCAKASICSERRALAEIRSEEHTSELQSLMRISYAVFCLKKKTNISTTSHTQHATHHQTHLNRNK